MLKFFRTIRRRLLKKGQLNKPASPAGKYLLYAIGEVALVVIGILIALQINNWNQNRLERIEEQKALQNLKTDFEFNRQSLQTAINRLKGMMEGTVLILNHTGKRYASSSTLQLDSLLILATSTPRYFPQNGFLNDLINSGKLGLIQSDSLRSYLSSWDAHMNFIEDRTNINHTHSIKITDYVSRHGNWLRVDAKNGLQHIQLPKSGFNISNLPLLQHQEFESLIELKIVFKDYLLTQFYEAMELCIKIQELIQQEIV